MGYYSFISRTKGSSCHTGARSCFIEASLKNYSKQDLEKMKGIWRGKFGEEYIRSFI